MPLLAMLTTMTQIDNTGQHPFSERVTNEVQRGLTIIPGMAVGVMSSSIIGFYMHNTHEYICARIDKRHMKTTPTT